MRRHLLFPAVVFLVGILLGIANLHTLPAQESLTPFVSSDVVFAEKDGILAVEAEHFFKQTLNEKRAFYLTTRDKTPTFEMDGDPNHTAGASGGAYLEILPDNRRNHGEKLIPGTNFSNEPGKLAVLHYKVNITNPGRYYVWVRAYSSGSEDNGLHVGIDGEWPANGQRMQWCEGKRSWWWESKQRTKKEHCGVPHQIYLDIKEAGEHTIHFSMREDGFEFDKWLMTTDRDMARPNDSGPESIVSAGKMPATFPMVAAASNRDTPAQTGTPTLAAKKANNSPALVLAANQFSLDGTDYYLDKGKWLAINPDQQKTATITKEFPFPAGNYNIILKAVGENDGQSTYDIKVSDNALPQFKCPLSDKMFEEGTKFYGRWKNISIKAKETISISSTVGTDGAEFSRARWAAIAFRPADKKTKALAQTFLNGQTKSPQDNERSANIDRSTSPTKPVSDKPLIEPRQEDGKGTIAISGELKTWHNITFTIDGPYAHEQDNAPNPYTDYRMEIEFKHQDGKSYVVPGYFAADGNAGETSAESGVKWRAHFSPDRIGRWSFKLSIGSGKLAAIDKSAPVKTLNQISGDFVVTASDKSGRDFRRHGRLQYVGKGYLQHAGTKKYFLKAGADAPETLLGYADFDNTIAGKAKRVPLKTFSAHVQDWTDGDPSWQNGKGKGLIGAVNYLSGKGCNAFSFLTYNAGGDGDNVWPFIQRDDKLHYDCSKLDQWATVFEHGTQKGMYLHFKLQETENDDHRGGHKKTDGYVPTSLDGGNLGVQRKLYLREMIARFGHNLALNWNLGEENTQTTVQQKAMIDYIKQTDPYGHNIVLHSYPDQQDKVYQPLLGDKSNLTGLSLQNSGIQDTHRHTVKWVRESKQSGKRWVVAFDESGTAAHGQCPDLGYKGFDGKDKDGKMIYTQHEVRRQTLWGHLMGGGAGVEYYFGYKFAENDLVCEDWRSRDQSWDYCRIALEFFRDNNIPVHEMEPMDELVGNLKHDNSRYCLVKPGELYLVYLPFGEKSELDLSNADGFFKVDWLNPRTGEMTKSDVTVAAGSKVVVSAPESSKEDWLVVIRKKKPEFKDRVD